MAQWYRFEVVFIEPPTKGAIKAFNKELREEDSDAPLLDAHGCAETSWRSPLLEVQELLQLFQKHGIECKFRLWETWASDYPLPWVYSSKVTEVKEKIKELSTEELEGFRKWLDTWEE